MLNRNRYSFTAKLFLIFLLSSFLSQTTWSQTDTIKVGYNIAPPFVEEENGKLTGSSIWLCDQLMEEHDLYFESEKYSLDSLLIKLGNGEIDLCASPLTITSERSKDIDFTAPNYIAQYYAMGMSQHLHPKFRAMINTSVLKNAERMDWKVMLSEYGFGSE